MKFLLDMQISPRIGLWLKSIGHDAIHVRDCGMAKAPDSEILKRAAQEGRILLTMDLDFPLIASSTT